MTKLIDITGQRFGRLIAIKRGENDKHGHTRWWCQCDCGSPLKLIDSAALRKGLVVSCGCNKKEKLKEYNDKNKLVDETGNVYGYLTVLRHAENVPSKDGRAQWVCKCKCGNEIITTGKLLRDGSKLSCGCMKKSKGELKIEQLLEKNHIIYAEQYTQYIEQNFYKVIEKHPYYFDFAILNDKKELLYLIEFDGKQHFEYNEKSDFWDNEEKFKLTQFRDKLKNQWCKDNNIPLIRIPYWHLKDLCIEDLKLETSSFII